jgi:hypothetical protein
VRNVQEILDTDFTAAYEEYCGKKLMNSENIEACRQKITENYQNIVGELSELQDYESFLENELQAFRRKTTEENGTIVLGRSFKDQNEIIYQRLIMLDVEKALMQKIRRHLIIESEIYQKQVNPEIEANILEHLVETRKLHLKKIEVQVNAEVQRIEKAFLEKWNQLSKPKKKFEINDWKLRTELMPTQTNLSQQLFEKQEKLAKTNEEIETLRTQKEENVAIDEEFREIFDALEVEFEKITVDIETDTKDIEQLRYHINKIASEIKATKEKQLKIVTDLNENRAIDERMKEIYRDGLEEKLKQTSESTTKKMRAEDCIVVGLTNAICQASRNIRNSKIQISRLQTDVDHLMDKGMKEIRGQDYLGSNFVKVECQ